MPTWCRPCTSACWRWSRRIRARHDLSALRQVASTGSPCPVPLKQAMIGWLGPVITEAYGSSEAGYTTFADSASWLRHPGSAGSPLPDAEVEILDEQGNALPPREIGLIYVRQHALPDFTYINRPEARQAVERDGLITLGDIGLPGRRRFSPYLRPQGRHGHLGRREHLSGGDRVGAADHAGHRRLRGLRRFPTRSSAKRLAAAIQLRPGHQVEGADVQAFLRERIANYKVPRIVEIHESLPREDTGKIFKRRLREPHWQDQARAI
ncbi:AMP-binding protein [Cupriavidus basilensis]